MGMFDSLYEDGNEYQTKALRRLLNAYFIGDKIPGPPIDYQMSVLGDNGYGFANIRDGHLAAITQARDASLPLRGYFGDWLDEEMETE